MPRHAPTDPKVRDLVARLAMLLLQFGSVNALAEALTRAGDGVRIYPHRLLALLSGDPTRGVNTATLDALLNATSAVPEPGQWIIEPEQVRAVAAAARTSLDPEAAWRRAGDELGIPPGVVRALAGDDVGTPAQSKPDSPRAATPDWSWQDRAVDAALASLRRRNDAKVGLIIPTGGGKTRIALLTALKWLREHEGTVLWVTHRRHLQKQARRTLHALVRESKSSPDEAAATFARVNFCLVGRALDEIRRLGEKLSCVIVDEAHHSAATSYAPILAQDIAPVLLLTATPNRADSLPIGLTSVAYETTYRELIERRCLVDPIFEPPEDMPTLDWSSKAGLYPLAEYLLDRTESDFSKPLVAVSQRERAEILYQAVCERLDARATHPLTNEDIAYVHGTSNSRGLNDASDLLDEFSASPVGILIATSQLVGEGFDDPNIDAAVLTYPSTSIAHLMQVAGRALRFAPGKTSAHVVQVRQSALEYHFEQRWLYQDISDQLRPELLHFTYGSERELHEKIASLISAHNVPKNEQAEIMSRVPQAASGESVRILLSGQPYFGPVGKFKDEASWRAILVTPEERSRFLGIFNDVSVRSEDIKEQYQYLRARFAPGSDPDYVFMAYAQLIPAMEYARRETTNVPYGGAENRPYRPGRASTWLKYLTFEFKPAIPNDLEVFLADAFNRERLFRGYCDDPHVWQLALRLELPVTGSEGFLLNNEQAVWFAEQIDAVTRLINASRREEALARISEWRVNLGSSPLPQRLISNFAQFLRPERIASHVLQLGLPAGSKAS